MDERITKGMPPQNIRPQTYSGIHATIPIIASIISPGITQNNA